MVYGIEAQSEDDPHIDMAERTMHTLVAAGGSPWFPIIDSFPWLRFIPKLLPKFRNCKCHHESPPVKLPRVAYEHVHQALVRIHYSFQTILPRGRHSLSQITGEAKPSVALHQIKSAEEQNKLSEEQNIVVKHSCATMFAAGSELVSLHCCTVSKSH
jgi:hypothetical protein